jgi:ABC-type transport system substrate-binding protein
MVGKFAAILVVGLMLISGIPVGESSTVHSRADDPVILRVAIQDDLSTLNYLSANDVWTWDVIGWVFDRLTWHNISNKDHVEPWAAEWFHHGSQDTWGEVAYPDEDNNTDYRNWTVKLRGGIKWHDWDSQTGDDRYVRAHDVIFSLRLAADVSRYAGSIGTIWLYSNNPNELTKYSINELSKVPNTE